MGYAVRFDRVVKRYPRGGPRYRSLRQDLADRLSPRRRRERRPPGGMLALDHVSFEVADGESYALIGPNGAGKTTCFKLISRISYPTSGSVSVRGRVGALIEAASGLHLELTGRENVWLYGRILGMSKRQIRAAFDEIVAFAELEHALDTPVKMYSSGMQLRLGFSIASHLDPDVLLVDEALAVGDAAFQARCADRMSRLVHEGRTLLFVSHDLQMVESICARGLFLLEGRVAYEGVVLDALTRYLDWVEERRLELIENQAGEGPLQVEAASCHDETGSERYEFRPGEAVEIRLRFGSDRGYERPHVTVGISDGRPSVLVGCSMLRDGQAPAHVGRTWECRLLIERLPLLPRLYHVYCDVYDGDRRVPLMAWSPVTTFRVASPLASPPRSVMHAAAAGAVDVPYRWTVTSDEVL